ncbi:MAG: hypothetical protein DWQ04_07080 [Chloroflexi bacterium]|nr:MAG: hypothetical protein DWQ04_07080 [Chloroflexota bacterium]
MTQYVDPVHLREVLTQYYSEGDLRSMCFDLAIDYESLGGRGKAQNAEALVRYAMQNNRIDDIAKYVRNTRDFIELKMTITPPKMPSDASGHAGRPTHVTHVHGDQISGDKVGGDKVSGDKTKIGNISGSTVAIGRGASITVGGDSGNRKTFSQQLQELKLLLEQAVANGELDKDDGETAVSDLQAALDESAKDTPRAKRIIRRLEDVTEVIGEAVKVGTAVLAAKPLINKLIQAASRIF